MIKIHNKVGTKTTVHCMLLSTTTISTITSMTIILSPITTTIDDANYLNQSSSPLAIIYDHYRQVLLHSLTVMYYHH